MHHIYQTEALVVRGANTGEANRFYFLFTKDLGMLMASAQGVRLLKSKLRYSLQDFSRSKVSLVRGKTGWRITSAGEIENFFAVFGKEQKKIELVVRVFSLIKHLLAGEEKNAPLYVLLRDGFDFLKNEITGEQLKNFECLLVLRILGNLGYFGTEKFQSFIESGEWSFDLLSLFDPLRNEALRGINSSLQASSLL